MSDRYILEGTTPKKCDDLIAWANWLENNNRTVIKTKTDDDSVEVSTVFLGLDHSFDSGNPLLFETLVFGGNFDGEMDRYSTWEQAEVGHAEMVKKVIGK